MPTIEGIEFSLFWDKDRDALKSLSFPGRAEWLRERVEAVLLKPLDTLKSEPKTFVWLAATELVCAGIEAFAGFYGKRFCEFVHEFMHADFANTAKNAKGKTWTYCQHLQEYFRNGLDHGFSIEWGGLWHDGENGMPGYLRPVSDSKGIAIDPLTFLDDFRKAVDAYFKKLTIDGENSITGKNFQKRFNAILEHRSRTR